MKNFITNVITLNILACGMLTLSGCNPSAQTDVLTMTVNRGDFVVDIPATGELEASKSVLINVPSGLRGPQSLSWIIDNFSYVKAGDVIARMDGTRQRFDLSKEQLNVNRLDLDSKIQKEKDATIDKSLTTDTKLTTKEQILADKFYSEDERVYTKIDIIDQMRNKDYLAAKMDYFDWGLTQHSTQAQAEQNLISLKQKSHLSKIKLYSNNLQQMEIKAPKAGLFVATRNWNGLTPSAGDMLWSGLTIGKLPETKTMQAKMFVLESEALGLSIGKTATVVLDAYPNKKFSGKVTQVDSLAKAKDQNSPVNYFEITISLTNTVTKIMKPGRQVTAKIHAFNIANVIAIPNQAIFQHQGKNWVYLRTPTGFVKQTVEVGTRSINCTEITSGINANDVIALTMPSKRSQVQ
ncbi:efflux RND transporter periplasmic adaptor subunit [Shewanella intestini]|uniref:HlyD family efflux transporter periplasmic adaptor subunit n=1 Tax=Shewanella intestini TaxID=2017544 RepID=A0ABS5HZR4_9GAMM|nr:MULTISPECIES: HlyD family efflux transporter periplasmic adaptor subunit [Shewanella]MBR9727161.1 HlyD family efflux transporter periplasmic adaptor subunit [Shewanella intestini]MRG35963.1 HlyD family efflux transporter periplasmic adaptor subunit [Shewanella sp. XMDDZSB0408]